MTAATVTLPRVAPTGGLTFGRVLNAEWIKFRSVRATLWTLPLTAVAMIGFAVLQAWGVSTLETNEDFTASAIVTGGTLFGQVVVSVLAVLTITGEYSTGQIRSSLAAVPRRLPVLWAKAMILAASVAVVGAVSVALSWLGALPFLNKMDLSIDLSNGDTVRALAGAPLYLAATALFAFAVGALLRHSAGALALVLGLLLVLENLFAALPFTFFEKVSPFLPSTAGSRILSDDASIDSMNMVTDGAHLTAWQGYGVLLVWVAVLLTAAAVLLRRRDA
jgi:ABC-2 type transport system permease protein